MGKVYRREGSRDRMKSDKSDTIKKAIIKSLEIGNTVSMACSDTGISRDTFYRWLTKDPDFKQEVEIAQNSRIKIVEDALYKNAVDNGNVTAQIFFLCNRYSERWQNVNKVEHGGKVIFDLAKEMEALEEEENDSN
jgi:hypothetical protein